MGKLESQLSLHYFENIKSYSLNNKRMVWVTNTAKLGRTKIWCSLNITTIVVAI